MQNLCLKALLYNFGTILSEILSQITKFKLESSALEFRYNFEWYFCVQLLSETLREIFIQNTKFKLDSSALEFQYNFEWLFCVQLLSDILEWTFEKFSLKIQNLRLKAVFSISVQFWVSALEFRYNF